METNVYYDLSALVWILQFSIPMFNKELLLLIAFNVIKIE